MSSYSHKQSSHKASSHSGAGSGAYGGGLGYEAGIGYGGGAGHHTSGAANYCFSSGSGVGFGGSYGGGAAGFGGHYGGGSGGYGGSYGGGAADFGGHYGGGFGGGDGILSGSEKQTMQNLNDRLANYLDKVRALEEANAELERKIKEWYEKQRAGSGSGDKGKDYSKYFAAIEQLKSQIVTAITQNTSVVLQIDNSRLAADDFKMKFESEQTLRQCVDADINGLRRVLDELTMTRSDMESQYENLAEEVAVLKKNLEAESKGGKEQTMGQITVEMNAAPSNDLTQVLNGMRAQYEAMAEKNRRDAEDRFNKMSEDLKKEIHTGAQQIQTSKSEVSDLKRTIQALEIELQSLIATRKSLENTVAETEGQYCMQIAQLQAQISIVEEQLALIREDIECQTREYEDLLDIKTRLEAEIEQYRRLLDGESGKGQAKQYTGTGSTSGSSTGSQMTRRVKQVIEYVDNGKVVKSEVVNKDIPY
ncbi:keratin-3, type I cytoskeletal 51 kDa-like isoform X2 [Bufo bufo]|uniref:keratin-3, type I cytoskeletal 51 kDa-like isoform X2 n=1 Tax=Bufo bufo TaxID=8384 RepID=UPI001ABE36A5|nr:keratin-3, type I cytoskeletal 51 kDa-like isoform X2 [Bufo bufo]